MPVAKESLMRLCWLAGVIIIGDSNDHAEKRRGTDLANLTPIRHRAFSVGEVSHQMSCYNKIFQEIIHYRYIINKTKGVYYDREAMSKRGVTSRFDPLPMLMGSALGGLLVDGKPVPSFDGKNRWAAAPDGAWVGDVVVPTNERPSEGYVDVSRRYSCGLGRRIAS